MSFYLLVIVNIYKQKIRTPDCFAEKRKSERVNACGTEILTAGPRPVKWGTYGPGRYLDDLLNIDNPYFEGMIIRIYPPELQLNKANTSDTEAPFLDLHLSISNGFISSKFMISAMTLILI